jgi:hypothetical protein
VRAEAAPEPRNSPQSRTRKRAVRERGHELAVFVNSPQLRLVRDLSVSAPRPIRDGGRAPQIVHQQATDNQA